MNKCLQLGPAIPNPLFCHYLTRHQLYAVLSKALDILDMDSKRFNSSVLILIPTRVVRTSNTNLLPVTLTEQLTLHYEKPKLGRLDRLWCLIFDILFSFYWSIILYNW